MPALIGVALLSGVMVLGNVYKKLDELLGNTELPLSVILEFVTLVIPFSLIFTIPWAFLTAITTSTPTSDRRICALTTSHTSSG